MSFVFYVTLRQYGARSFLQWHDRLLYGLEKSRDFFTSFVGVGRLPYVLQGDIRVVEGKGADSESLLLP